MMRILLIIFSCILTQSAMAQIIKSPIDNNEYRYFQLENKLNVLLVHDEDSDLSAASLNVAVGSASNPKEWLGLAHFLEHMLFLGTKKYPIVGQYSQFIKTNGGRMNAYTAPHNTNYYFSINPPKFQQALDRFSRFFIDPTFNPNFVERERHVVHSEFQARRKTEGMRLYSVGNEQKNPNHPLSRFTIGSNETLADKGDGENKQSVRDALIDFYERYYSANLMSLVLVSSESLDTMEKWVKQKFADIPNKNVEKPIFDIPLYEENNKDKQLLLVKPEKDIYQLQYQFPMPSIYEEYDTKPSRILGAIIGDESEGSLLALLREKGYAVGLSTGTAYSDPVQSVSNIRIQLTPKGAENLDEVHKLVFAAIKLSKQGIQEWRYEEAKQLAQIDFRFKQSQTSMKLASTLSARMQDIPVKDLLQYPYLYTQFDESRTEELWQYLTPENVYITFVSPEVETNQVSEYFDVHYALAPLSESQIESWQNVTIPEELKLPKRNPFIANRLELLEHEEVTKSPVLIDETKNVDVWYQADSEFDSPRASFYLALMSPKAKMDVKQDVLTQQWLQIVRHRLKKQTYAASLASLSFDIYSHLRGVSLRIGGYEDKQTELLSLILSELANNDFNESEFETFKLELLRKWGNADKESVQQQIFQAFWRDLVTPSFTEAEKIAALESLSVEDLKKRHKDFFKTVYMRVLSHGDVAKDVTQERVDIIKAWLRNSDFVAEPALPEVKKIQNAKESIKSIDIDHNDSGYLLYFQGQTDSLKEKAHINLLSNLMSSEYYQSLRTENRVGYIVYASQYSVVEWPGLVFFAQSPTHGPATLNNLSIAFLQDYFHTLKKLDSSDFNQAKQALINNIQAPDDTLSKRSQRLWREIDRKKYGFEYRQKLVLAIEAITLEDMVDFYEKFILNNEAMMIVQSKGHGAEDAKLVKTLNIVADWTEKAIKNNDKKQKLLNDNKLDDSLKDKVKKSDG